MAMSEGKFTLEVWITAIEIPGDLGPNSSDEGPPQLAPEELVSAAKMEEQYAPNSPHTIVDVEPDVEPTVRHSRNRGYPLSIDEELRFMNDEDESATRRSNQQLEGPKIPKVPNMLRKLNTNKGCFDPLAVSIGPYHHGKPELQEVERLKPKLARQYCHHYQVRHFYEKVKRVASRAKEFYDIESLEEFDDYEFTKMMFLDGCFILQFSLLLLREDYQAMGMKNNVIANVKRDLFLLENQLPCIVLEELLHGDKEHLYEVLAFLIRICQRFPPAIKWSWWLSYPIELRSSPEDDDDDDKHPFHLLDHTMSRFVKQSGAVQDRKTQGSAPYMIRDLVRKHSDDRYSYYPARVLKSMGIWFSPNMTCCLSDVKFESYRFFRGMLKLPPFVVDASTKSMLLNMLAFELSRNVQGGITSYMCFMDSLIDNAEDVEILRTQNVIINCLGTDQQVADLFNDIASNLVPNPLIYAEAKREIQKHCNNKFYKWMAEGHATHFRNPWTLTAIFSGFLLIILTAAQTYFAAVQGK